MAKPYAQLRARMSPDAQRQAQDKARALLASNEAPRPSGFEVAYAQRQEDEARADDDAGTFPP